MRKNVFVALLAAAFAITGCGDDKKDDDKKDGGKDAKCAEAAIVYSCDMPALKTCTGYSKGLMTEEQLSTSCGDPGEFSAAPCDTEGLAGSCELPCQSDQQNRAIMYYYEDFAGGADIAKQACEQLNGTWKDA